MFFILSKTAAFLVMPSNVLIGLGVAGIVLLLTRWKRAGVRLMAASIVLMLLAGFLPIGIILAYPLETRFPPWDPARGTPDGIVVLGGAINPSLSRIYRATQLNENAERVTVIAKLARDFPNARIVYSSGDASLSGIAGREAHYLYPLLQTFGVPRDRVILEDAARNTYENATFTKALIKPKPGEHWLLVTSAMHMPRAMGCFRRVGFPVEAYPVDWHMGPRPRLRFFDQLSSGLSSLDDAVHEWLGLIVYRMTGRTDALFPAPAGRS